MQGAGAMPQQLAGCVGYVLMIPSAEHSQCMRSMVFSPNDSPLSGREGTHLTGSKIGERLAAEAATSVSLRVLPAGEGGEAFEVQARGELQLGLLIGAALMDADGSKA